MCVDTLAYRVSWSCHFGSFLHGRCQFSLVLLLTNLPNRHFQTKLCLFTTFIPAFVVDFSCLPLCQHQDSHQDARSYYSEAENPVETRKSHHSKRNFNHGPSRPPLTDNQLRTSSSSTMPPGKRVSTAKRTKASHAKAKKAQQRKRQKLEEDPKKQDHDLEDSESDDEVEARRERKRQGKSKKLASQAKKKHPDPQDSESEEEQDDDIPDDEDDTPDDGDKLNPMSKKLQETLLELANLKRENQQLKSQKGPSSGKISEDDESDFSDKARNQDDEDQETRWSNRKIKEHVRKFGYVPVKTDMESQIYRSADKLLFRFIKFIPKDDYIRPACEKLLEKDPQLADYYKVQSLDPKQYKRLVKKFEKDYGDAVCRGINKARTTAQSEMKKAFIKGVPIFGSIKNMPTPKEIQNVILRKGLINPDDLENDSIDPGFMPYARPDNIQKELDAAQETVNRYSGTHDDSNDETVDVGKESTKQRKKVTRKAKENGKAAKELSEDDQRLLRVAKKQLVLYGKQDEEAQEKHEEVREEAWKKHRKEQYERSMKVFIWYWTGLLPCICRNHQWGQTKRLHGHISTHTPPNDSKDKYVTVTDESFVGIVYENCGQRFPFLAGLAAKNVAYDQQIHASDPLYQAKWSSSTKGHCKHGGWDHKAVVRFDKIAKLVARNRLKDADHLEEVETAALNRIQGIEDGALPGNDDEEVEEIVELPKNFAAMAYDSDVDVELEELELEDPVEVYLPVPESKDEKKKKAKASKSG